MTAPLEIPAHLQAVLDGMETRSRQMGRPWVTLTYAQSLDGSIAARRGENLILSGPESLRVTHALRAAHPAILVGIGTLLADNPRLNLRLAPGSDPQPVILDNQLRTPPDARVFKGPKPPWVMTSAQAAPERQRVLQAAGGRVFRPSSADRFSLAEILQVLKTEGQHAVMVEGGASVITAFLQAHLVDFVLLTISLGFIGGLSALQNTLAPNFPRLKNIQTRLCGEDLLLWGHLSD